MPDNSFNTTKLILIQFSAVLLLIFNQAVHAETRYYDVEVIIYEDANATYLHSEDWQDEAAFRQENQQDTSSMSLNNIASLKLEKPVVSTLPAGIATEKPTDNNKFFQNIEPTILTKEAKRIQHSSHYNLLFYTAWRQPGLDAKNAIAINLKDLVNHAQLKTQNSIEGTLKVVLSRYLHFYTKLDYLHHEMVQIKTEPTQLKPYLTGTDVIVGADKRLSADRPTPLALVIKHYPVVSHRRMRSKVLHYLDNPLVGILVQINQTKPPVPKKLTAPVPLQHPSSN